jgi:hypothetical protein
MRLTALETTMDVQIPDLDPVQLAWICEALIPTDPRGIYPSAYDAGVASTWLVHVLKLRDDILPTISLALSRLPSDQPDDPLELLRSLGPVFDRLSFAIVGAYFRSPLVVQGIGYFGQLAIIEPPAFSEIEELIRWVT